MNKHEDCKTGLNLVNILFCVVTVGRLCPPRTFHCRNSRCIPEHQQCNGVNDCGDFSDEVNCGCAPGQFQCKHNGTCIQGRHKCDFEKDCWDASDEMGCCK